MANIRENLVEFNPWWGGTFRVEGYRDREVYGSLGPFLRQPQIVALTGLRRTGKTTILLRIVEDAIAGGQDPKHILYFSFDEFRAVRLREVLGEYESATSKDLRTGRFLVLVGVTEKSIVRRYLRESIVEKVVFRDLPGLLGIRDLSVLESLVNLLMEEPGQILQVSELAGTLAVSSDTLSNYLMYLEQSFLLRKVYNFSTGRRKVERKLRRYYPTIVSPDLAFATDDLSRSRVFEWALVRELRAEYFWRDAYKNEVDVVLPAKKPIPVEIKSGKVETRGVEAFLRKFRADKGHVVTRDQEGERAVDGGRIRIVPAYRFLLESRIANPD